ncbi:MAG TPA: SAM-dependent chlorinase/fluorinase [Candidatus Binatia bacterium]|jgi:hypothetical protein
MLITLTTDFGLRDPFVGVMKGVIAGINPQAQVIDVTHGIPAQDVLAGALVLRHSVTYFPPGSVHVAVVDPGVGSIRRPILIECGGSYFIGPDNGVLSLAIAAFKPATIVELSNLTYQLPAAGTTFHGRDIFAPAAAHLSLGIAPAAFGRKLDSFFRLALPEIMRRQNTLEGEIIYIDAFGNLFTNIEEHDVTWRSTGCAISMGAVRIQGLSPSYAAAGCGEFVAVINSWGVLEIAVNQGSAQRSSGASIGDKVRLVFGS